MPEQMLIITHVAPYADGPAGVHGVLGQAATALEELSEAAGLESTVVRDVRDLSPDQLGAARVVALFTIGETPFTDAHKGALYEAWTGGRLGVLGIHSATDACHTWDEYGTVLGARFDGHPWTQDFALEVLDGTHPATAHLGPQWAWRDEIYLFKDFDPDAHVLLALAEGQVDMTARGARVPDCGFPLAWCIERGRARTFYSALGHFPGAWETPAYLRHLAGGLAWLGAAT